MAKPSGGQEFLERGLPHNLDAERSILGAILLDVAAIDVAMEHVKPEAFFLDQHRRIYERMIDLREAQQGIDLVTLTDVLARHGELESAGGPAYLAQLVDGVPRVSNIKHYALIVVEKALLRNLVHTAYAIQQKALEGEEPARDILESSESLIFQLADQEVRAGFVGFKEVVTKNFEHLHRILTEGRSITGLATGYPVLDGYTCGLQDSELIIVGARPSVGKTAFALNIAENIAVRAEEPRTVGIFSLEMSKESLLLRMIGSHAKIDSHKFRSGRLGQSDWTKMTTTLGVLGEAPLWVDDEPGLGVMEIGAKSRRLKREKGLSLVIVDYLQLMVGRGKFSNRQEEVASISRALKGLAKELRVPVLVLSQLTRNPGKENRKPQLADLRESGAIEQDADMVILIHRPGAYTHKDEAARLKAELIIAKQRNGPTAKMDFIFLEKWTRWEQAAKQSDEAEEEAATAEELFE